MIHKRVFLVHALEDNNVSKTVPWEWRLLNTPASRLPADGQKTKIFAYDDHIIPLALRIVWKGCYRISIVLAFSWGRACVTGVKRGRGNLGARGRVGRGPRVWSRALIPFPLPFERLPRRLHVDGCEKSQDILSGFVWAGSLSTACCEEQPFLAFHISDYTNSDRCIFSIQALSWCVSLQNCGNRLWKWQSLLYSGKFISKSALSH